jgi:predicted RNase H-like nuclease (RuvC/YqgF family)
MAEIEQLRAERDDLLKANALLHALVGNREAEIERLKADKDVIRSQERNAAYERDIAALEAEIEQLRAVLNNLDACAVPTAEQIEQMEKARNVNRAMAALEQKSPCYANLVESRPLLEVRLPRLANIVDKLVRYGNFTEDEWCHFDHRIVRFLTRM